MKISKITLKIVLLFSLSITILTILSSLIFIGYFNDNFTKNIERNLQKKSLTISLLINSKADSRDSLDSLLEVFYNRGERILILNGKGLIISDSWSLSDINWQYYSSYMEVGDKLKRRSLPHLLLLKLHKILNKEDNYPSGDEFKNLGSGDYFKGVEFKMAKSKQSGRAIRRDIDGSLIYSYCYKAGNSGYYTVVSSSTSELLNSMDLIIDRYIKYFYILLFINLFISLLISLTIIVPIVKLKNRVNIITKEYKRKNLPLPYLNRRDEIGDLTKSFYKLYTKLNSHLDYSEAYTTDIIHELKNPLAIIGSAAETLDGDRELLDIIYNNINRSQLLLDDLRELTLIDTRDSVDDQPIDLNNYFREKIKGFSYQFPLIEFIFKTDNNINILISSQRLDQIIDNIVLNCVDFTRDKIFIELKKDSSRVNILISDNGPGISEDSIARVFNRFYSTRKNRNGHSGLGLSIVKSIVYNYQGTIRVENRDGALFTIVFDTI